MRLPGFHQAHVNHPMLRPAGGVHTIGAAIIVLGSLLSLPFSTAGQTASNGTNPSANGVEFGRIEGVVRMGRQAVANETLTLRPTPASATNQDALVRQTITDDGGRYVFTGVPAGKWTISRSHGMRDIFGISVLVEAGKTSRLDVGGKGRPVIGKVTLPAEILAGRDHVILPPSRLYLEFADTTNFQQQLKDPRQLEVKLAGRGFSDQAQLSTDGTFRLEDVPAGTNWLTVEVLCFPARGGTGSNVASTSLRFVAPDMPGGRNDVPLDLGTFEPVMIHTPQAGETAALFEVETTNAGIFKLANHRGQYVLLDLEPLTGHDQWDTNLAGVWASFGTNPGLAMLTIEVPPTAGSSITAIIMGEEFGGTFRKPGPWPMASFLRVPFYEQLPLRAGYGLECDRSFAPGPNLPGVVLIGPDGKIVARDLHGDAIKAAVGKALGALK